MIELHRPGPRYGFVDREDQAGFIPMCIGNWPDLRQLIAALSATGVPKARPPKPGFKPSKSLRKPRARRKK